MKINKFILYIVGIIIVAAGYFAFSQSQLFKPVICTQDAYVCPDGTPLARTGRDCHFPSCPTKPQQNITVTEPTANQEIGLPLVINGQARVFENVMNYRLKDFDGTVLVEGFASAQAPDVGQFGPYHVAVSYPQPKGKNGSLEVFSRSAKDGEEINKITIPIVFATVDTQAVKVFFGNRLKDIKMLDCSKVFPVVRRIAKTQAVAQSALQELLQGTTFQELNQGYFTNINPDVQINSIKIENGVASVDFSQGLQAGVAGSCRVTAIRSQIEQTLKQFPTVKTVVLSINGQTQDILQP